MAFKSPLLPYPKFPAEVPELPLRLPNDTGSPTYVTQAVLQQERPNGVALTGTTQTGEQVSIAVTIVAPGVVRVLLEDDQPTPARVTLAHPGTETSDSVTVETSSRHVVLADDAIRIQIDLERLHMSFYRSDGRLLLSQNSTDSDVVDRLTALPFGFSDIDGQRVAFHEAFTAEPDEHYYGFGEKFTDFDKRGQRLTMWNMDAFGVHSERAYKNVPFFTSSRGYGVFVDSIRAIRFDMAATSHSVCSIAVPDSALDYYVITGPDLKSIITRYAGLVSYPILPPRWAFGLWMSSGFKEDSADDVMNRAQELREQEIPCDVFHLDCYWQRFGRWSEMIWDEAMFPDPQHMISQLKAQGFKICLWINPYLGIESELFADAGEKGYLLKTKAGDVWVGDLWSESHPPVGIVDMTNPEAVDWYKGLLLPHLKMGVDVFKTDFGEGIPPDVVAWNGMSGEELHNLYALLYNDAVAELTAAETDHTGLVWGRSSYAGGQRHAAQWGGDPDCTYAALASTLRGGLSLGMCGHPFWSHDIGGFHVKPSPDLFVRWAQFGLLSPLSRAHGMSTRLPWDYGHEAERIFRKYVELRYQLLPYIEHYARISAETSLPLIRPMVLEFPDDPNTYTMDLQYMFGESLLVAPIYNAEGVRPVYFPEGIWIDYWTHELIHGICNRYVEAPLDRMPMYVRANSIIPTISAAAHTTEEPYSDIVFDGYLLDEGHFKLNDVDGQSEITTHLDGVNLSINWSGPKQGISFRLLRLVENSLVEKVFINGEVIPFGTSEAISSWNRDPESHAIVRIN